MMLCDVKSTMNVPVSHVKQLHEIEIFQKFVIIGIWLSKCPEKLKTNWRYGNIVAEALILDQEKYWHIPGIFCKFQYSWKENRKK